MKKKETWKFILQTLPMKKKETWKFILQTLLSVLSAIATAFGVASCIG